MDASPDYHVEIEGLDEASTAAPAMAGGEGSAQPRPWLGIRFDCCGTYTRVYRNAAGSAYEGRCPRCMRSVRLRVGPDGTASRFFVAE